MHVNPLFPASDHHPIAITPGQDASLEGLYECLAASEDRIRQLLFKHGAILFRGFALNGAHDFRSCVERLGATPFEYIGGNSPRSRVAVDVYTSTEYPASQVISLHNEMSYLPRWPSRLFFYSLLPAKSGGQTSLANSGDVMRALPVEIVRKLRDKKINYIRNFHSNFPLGKSWQATYQTEDRAEVESTAAEQGSTCEWLPGGMLRVSTCCDALMTHPQSGEEVWFNQAEQWHASALEPVTREMLEQMVGKGNLPHECEYGDGEPLEDNVLAQIRQALDASKLLFDWQHNDLLMVDNILMMHGRESFKGERKTLAYLSAT